MSQYLWLSGDLITAARLNANSYSLFKGIAGSEDTIILADNVAGTLQLKPNVDPAPSTQLFQVSNAAAVLQMAICADGSIVPNPAGASNTTMVKLAEVVSAGNQATIQFSAIPQTYRHLHLKGWTVLSAGGNQMWVRANGDAAGHYGYCYTQAGGGTVTSTESNAQSAVVLTNAGGDLRGFTLDIPLYSVANTTQAFVGSAVVTSSVNGAVGFGITSVGSWNPGAAITALTFLLSAGNFVNGSVVTLYGCP